MIPFRRTYRMVVLWSVQRLRIDQTTQQNNKFLPTKIIIFPPYSETDGSQENIRDCISTVAADLSRRKAG